MNFPEIPGKNEREALLLTQPEIEVSAKDFEDAFSARCENTQLVKRAVGGQLAADIRKRVSAPDDTPVFITELSGIAQIGDETWENFQELVVECGEHEIDFAMYSSESNFASMLTWLDQDPSGPIDRHHW